jgi:hypothetical protein
MAATLQLGSIVWVEVADANGIVKLRPAVIITATDRISDTGSLDVVAVTSRLVERSRAITSCYLGTQKDTLARASTGDVPPCAVGSCRFNLAVCARWPA